MKLGNTHSIEFVQWSRFMRLAVFTIVFLWCVSASSQPVLNFKRVVNNWPMIELYFFAACDGSPVYQLDTAQFRITENGRLIDEFDYWIPDPSSRCSASICFVSDISESMIHYVDVMTRDISVIVDEADGVADELSLLPFQCEPVQPIRMTTIKQLIYEGLSRLRPDGLSSVWDATYEGLVELIANGSNACRAVILFTDGIDNCSKRTVNDVISLATRNRIRVFTIGYGERVGEADSRRLAESTGGSYLFEPTGARLKKLYIEISTYISQAFIEPLVVYNSSCPDGSIRNVEFTLKFCGGQDTRTRTYKAPYIPAEIVPVTLALDTVVANAQTQTVFPIRMSPPTKYEQLTPATMKLAFDTALFDLAGVDPSGTYLEGTHAIISPLGDGASIRFEGTHRLDADSILTRLLFVPRNRDLHLFNPVDITSFEGTCFMVTSSHGGMVVAPVVPGSRAFLARALAPELILDKRTGSFNPSPLRLDVTVANRGTASIDSLPIRIEVPDGLWLAGSDSLSDGRALITNILSGEERQHSWEIGYDVHDTSRVLFFTVVVSDGNDDSMRVDGSVTIPAKAKTSVLLFETLPTVVFRDSLQVYEPNPFEVSVRPFHSGGVSLRSGQVRLFLDSLLTFTDGSDDGIRSLAAIPLHEGDSSVALTWDVRYDGRIPRSQQRALRWQFTGITIRGDTVSKILERSIIFPAAVSPLRSTFSAWPKQVLYDDSTTSYTVEVELKNESTLPAILKDVALKLPAPNSIFRFDPSSPGSKTLDTLIDAGRSVSVTWKLTRVENGYTGSFTLDCDATDGFGNTITSAVQGKAGWTHPVIECQIRPSHTRLVYDSTTGSFEPAMLSVTVLAGRHSAPPANLAAYLDWRTVSGIERVTLDPNVGGNTRMRADVVAARPVDTLTWVFEMARPSSMTEPDTVCFRLGVVGDSLPPSETRCETCVELVPSATTDVRRIDRPVAFLLEPNYPNPFSQKTEIAFELPRASLVRIAVYDLLGRHVHTLMNSWTNAGKHTAIFEAAGLPDGMYFYRMDSREGIAVRKMVVKR